MTLIFRQKDKDYLKNKVFSKYTLFCLIGFVISFSFLIYLWGSPILGINYWAENRSYSTTCAEEDNVNVPIFGPQVSHYRVVATHPTYCPCTYDGCPPDFSGCPSYGDGSTETCTKLWDDGINVVEVCTLSDWWRPYSMNCLVNGKTASCHYLRLYRKITGENMWPQFLVLYEDGNMRIKPHPPEGIEDVCLGSSVIIGPATPTTRPYVDIQEVRVNPTQLSLDITYRNGETAHINLLVDRSQAVAEVEMGYSTSTEIPFVTFRSMWVEHGNCDVDHIQSPDGDFSILGSWTSLNGPRWFFYRKFWSKHNSSAPDIRIEVLPLYVLHLGMEGNEDIFPQETAIQPYYAGAASALMALKYLDAGYLQSQDYLYQTYHLGPVGEEMNQADLRDAMNGEAPQEYNFGNLEDNEQDMAIKRFIHWMDYQVVGAVVHNVPSMIPTDGNFNWKVVRGFMTDIDPCNQDDIFDIPEFQVFGFWLNDPKVDGLGFNIYQTAEEFLSTYLPIEGSYRSVAEPPEGIDIRKLDHMLLMAKVGFAKSKPINELFYRTKSGFALDSYNLRQYFRRVEGLDWKEVIPIGLKTDPVFMEIFSKTEFSRILKVKDLNANQRYILVLFSKNINKKGVSVALIIDPETGAFRQASWIHKEEKYPRISKRKAIKIAIKALRAKYRKPARASLVWSRDFNSSRFQPSYEIVFKPSYSNYDRKAFTKKIHPTLTYWRKVIVYVHQDGSWEVVRSKGGGKEGNRRWK